MSFDLKDILDVVRTQASGYATWLGNSLQSPSYIARQSKEWKPALRARAAEPGAAQDQFFVVLIISAALGATLGGIIPGRPPLAERSTVAVVVILVWYFVSLILHFFIRLFRGSARLRVTVRLMMQLLALAYVASNFLALVTISIVSSMPGHEHTFGTNGFPPGFLIIGLQAVFLFLYLPLTVKRAHGFRGIVAGLAIGFLGAAITLLVAGTLAAQQHC
jgi:hypothetical protein